jgi:hypothetical protein
LRRFLFIGVLLVAGLTALPSPASPQFERTAGSVEFQLFDGAGSARVRMRGNFLGHVGRGRIIATRAVTLSGCERRRALTSTLRECRGTNLGFRTPAWTTWRLRLVGRNIDAGGFVRGCTTLNGIDTGYRGRFKIGDVKRVWPLRATKYRLGAGC